MLGARFQLPPTIALRDLVDEFQSLIALVTTAALVQPRF